MPNLSKLKNRIQKLGLFLLGLFLIFMVGNEALPPPEIKPFSQTVYAADSTLLCAYLTADEKWRLRTSLDQISKEMVEAIIAKEDRYFYQHPGVNLIALARALVLNITSGERTSGASTITMQFARMAEPGPRTYSRKFREMLRALQYEWRYSKKEILEMYLSYLPYGGNVEGVPAASHLYFGRAPDKLSLAQAVLLAVIPNRPNSLRPDRKTQAAKKMRDKWLRRFAEEEVFDKSTVKHAIQESVPDQRLELPPKTPQFCQHLRAIHKENNQPIYATLQPSIQAQVSKLLANHIRRIQAIGVSNGAVLVLDNRDGSVAAYCGSADFYNIEARGQVDGIQAIRSPGSTLKPFAYAQAFDRGMLTPKVRMLDVPITYKGFSPENYDRQFHGWVTTKYALAHSLNIPVVRLVKEIGLQPFIQLMEQMEFQTISKQKKGLGLSVILGGCGVSLEELTVAYSSFAREGIRYEAVYEKGQEPTQGKRIFSLGSSWMTAKILSSLARPDLPQRFIDDSNLPKVAWKTGTSYGRRDAWSIGFSPRYTVGVWMGNFDGHGVPGISGSSTAVPLLLDIFNAIDYAKGDWFPQPGEVQERMVCAETGMLPSPYCSQQIKDYYLPQTSSEKTCDLYKELFVNADSSMQFCPTCLPKIGFQKAAYPSYDPELVLWNIENTIPFKTAPLHNPSCQAFHSGKGPVIISPSPDLEYLIERGNEQEILLQSTIDADVQFHYWYINGRFFKKAKAGEKVFYLPKTSQLKISCVDDKGRKSKVVVKVGFY